MKALKELFTNLLVGKPKLKIEIQKLYYLYVPAGEKHAILLEPVLYPSTYQLLIGIENQSPRQTAIKDVRLEINKRDIPCVNQGGVKFGPHEYKQLLWVFPVDPKVGLKSGHFTLTIVDIYGTTFVRQGRFPIGTRIEPVLREPI
jgi:hypothetical protein|uniref:Uncharacterized protein n=1 Tax=candidate division WOR-3 bacterium TaxID=2052148 RepID=A0A7C6EBW6_UNCW3